MLSGWRKILLIATGLYALAKSPKRSRVLDTPDDGPGDEQGMDSNMGPQTVLSSHEMPLPIKRIALQNCSGDQCTHAVALHCAIHTRQGRESTLNSRWQNQGPAVPAERPNQALRATETTLQPPPGFTDTTATSDTTDTTEHKTDHATVCTLPLRRANATQQSPATIQARRYPIRVQHFSSLRTKWQNLRSPNATIFWCHNTLACTRRKEVVLCSPEARERTAATIEARPRQHTPSNNIAIATDQIPARKHQPREKYSKPCLPTWYTNHVGTPHEPRPENPAREAQQEETAARKPGCSQLHTISQNFARKPQQCDKYTTPTLRPWYSSHKDTTPEPHTGEAPQQRPEARKPRKLPKTSTKLRLFPTKLRLSTKLFSKLREFRKRENSPTLSLYQEQTSLGATLQFNAVTYFENDCGVQVTKKADRFMDASEVELWTKAMASGVADENGTLLNVPEINSVGQFGEKGAVYINFKDNIRGDAHYWLTELIETVGEHITIQVGHKTQQFHLVIKQVWEESLDERAPSATLWGAIQLPPGMILKIGKEEIERILADHGFSVRKVTQRYLKMRDEATGQKIKTKTLDDSFAFVMDEPVFHTMEDQMPSRLMCQYGSVGLRYTLDPSWSSAKNICVQCHQSFLQDRAHYCTEATRKRTSMTRDEHSAQQARFETIAAEKSAMIEGSLKATPCNRFMKNGACKAGANCRFLHGKLELVKSISLLLLEVEDHG